MFLVVRDISRVCVYPHVCVRMLLGVQFSSWMSVLWVCVSAVVLRRHVGPLKHLNQGMIHSWHVTGGAAQLVLQTHAGAAQQPL
jgi:hypothetical protein